MPAGPSTGGADAAPAALGLREVIAIGVGGMIGGGIFSVLGLGVRLSGPGVSAAFVLGAVVALTAGYSYVRLAVTYRRNGASYTYLRTAYPDRPLVGAVVGWTVVVGYVGTLSLYAFTFGAYGADLAGRPGSTSLRLTLSAGVIVGLALVNLRGIRSSGLVEDVLVYSKILLLTVLAAAGLASVEPQRVTPVFEDGATSVFVAGALIFVAFEGFQLITNTVENTRDPGRNIPRGIYGSILITSAIYITLAVVAVGNLPIADLVDAEEYSLARATEPILGLLGRDLVAVAALLATSSAINSTVLGSSQMAAQMGDDATMPRAMARRVGGTPRTAILTVSALALVLSLLASLEFIATFSSITFLLVTGAVQVANLRLRRETQARLSVVSVGLALTAATLATVVVHLAFNDRAVLAGLALFYALVAVAAVAAVYHATPSPEQAGRNARDRRAH